MTRARATSDAGGDGARGGPAVALVLDRAPEDSEARAKLEEIVGWLFARGARHVTLVGAGEIDAPSLSSQESLLGSGQGRAAVAEAVAALVRTGTAITHESLDAEIARRCGPAPDLILLVGENARLDDGLCWNAAYAELVLLPAPWDALSEADIARAIADFARRDRRFGALGPAAS